MRGSNQSLWEAVLALVAAALVGSLVVYMWRTGKRMKREIEGRLELSASRAGWAAFAGVMGFTVLMITREGMETALLMVTLLFQVKQVDVLAGALVGTAAAAFVAWLWSRYGQRVNLARFFQVTAVFLIVFVVQLVIYGFHELTEANVGIPNAQRAPRSHRAVRAGRPLRSLVDVLAGGVADGLAAGLEPVPAASAGARALTLVRPFRRGRRARRVNGALRPSLRRSDR